ncbi:hypothetical protein EXU85_33435 [Spirosoma sp. KCTC 42546]|uniref:hypothetical protein n=1 Tax=Spirosoma sp. KCTC 42546 TaxID=2520506 RepID=UPI00115A4545|nr:hypothetical protein [Spirosoma sp. KCTC 42546]QDK83244.1 hypothetical protein EXU85_33435 [Spirosoma sp. KCTC 42546]
MRNPFFYILLLVLVVLDGWLLAHPNLIGQAGVFFFDYSAIETFPKAIGTVSIVISVSILITWLAGRLSQPVAIGITIALLVGSVYYLFQSFSQYNTGIYKLTGAGFRAGAILLPALVVLVFGKGVWDVISNKRS